MNLNLEATDTGPNAVEDLADVLERIARQLRDGMTSGMDRKEDGRYNWTTTED